MPPDGPEVEDEAAAVAVCFTDTAFSPAPVGFAATF